MAQTEPQQIENADTKTVVADVEQGENSNIIGKNNVARSIDELNADLETLADMAAGKLIDSANNVAEDDLQENGGTLAAQDGADDIDNITADMPEQYTNNAVEVDGNVFFTDETDSTFTEPSASSPKDATPLQRAVGEMYGNPVLTEDQKTIKSIGKKLGWKILFDNVYVKDAQGNKVLDKMNRPIRANADIDFKNRTITIDFNCKKPVEFLIKHELTDYISQNRAVFFDLMNTVMDSGMFNEWVKSKGYVSVQDMVADVIQQRTAAGDPNFVGKSQNDLEIEANIEMTSDFIGENCFGGKNSLDGFLESLQPEQRKTFIQRILDFLRSVRDRIAGHKTLEDDITRIEKQFVKAYRAVEVSQQQKNTDQKGGVRYNIEYINADENSQLSSLVERVSRGDFVAKEKVYLGVVSKEIANKIYELTGVDVDGFKIAIEARQIEHILKDHGVNGKSDSSMSDVSDIAKMDYVLKSPDDIRNAGKTQAYSYMKNGYNRTAETVLYEKIIGDKSYYVIQAVADTKAKTLYVVSAFIGEKGYKKEASQLINAKSPNVTSNDGSANASNISIYNPNENVNTKDSQSKATETEHRYSITPETQLDLFEKFKSGEISEDEYRQIISNEKVLNPVEIANLTEKDANTTPKLEKQKGVNKGNKQSKTYGSLLGSSIFDDTFKDEIKDNTYIKKYQSVTNRETLAKAARELDQGGEAYVTRWNNKAPDEASLIDIAAGFILMDRYKNTRYYTTVYNG